MSKNGTAPTTPPAFASVAIDTLPDAVRASSPETIALGQAIIAAMDGGNAAVDPATYPTRKDGTTRAAALKRAVAAVAKSRDVMSRVYAEGDAFRVAILDKPAEASAEASETTEGAPE